jgi:Uncharacterized protein conserved in bacteria (DUF2252)
MHHLDVWYLHAEVDAPRGQVAARASSERLRMCEAKVAKMRRKTGMRAFSRLTERVDGKLRIASDPPVLAPIKELAGGRRQAAEDRIREVVDSCRQLLSPTRRHLFDGYRCTAPCEYTTRADASWWDNSSCSGRGAGPLPASPWCRDERRGGRAAPRDGCWRHDWDGSRTPTRRLPTRRRGGGSGAGACRYEGVYCDEVLTSLIVLRGDDLGDDRGGDRSADDVVAGGPRRRA